MTSQRDHSYPQRSQLPQRGYAPSRGHSPTGRSRPSREVTATPRGHGPLGRSQLLPEVTVPQGGHSCPQRSEPPRVVIAASRGHGPPGRSWLPQGGHGPLGRSQPPPEVTAPRGGHSGPQACELAPSGKGSRLTVDSGPQHGWDPLSWASRVCSGSPPREHSGATGWRGQRCGQGDQLHRQLLQVTRHLQGLLPSRWDLGEGGRPAGAEDRRQLDPGPDAGTGRAQGWGSGQRIQVRWTLPSAQPSPGGKGPESLQTRSEVGTACKDGGGPGGGSAARHPSVARRPPAGLHPAVVRPIVLGSQVGAERHPLRCLGARAAFSPGHDVPAPGRCDVWGHSPGATLIPPPPAS